MSKAPERIYIRDGSWLHISPEERFYTIGGRVFDTDHGYVHHSVAYGYASEVESLKGALATLHGRPFSERVYVALHARMQAAEALLGAAHERVAQYESALCQISRNAAVMTSHQIETMARDALTKET